MTRQVTADVGSLSCVSMRIRSCNASSFVQVTALAELCGGNPQMYGLNSECDGKVWRIDVGMSSGVLNAEAQVHVRSGSWPI